MNQIKSAVTWAISAPCGEPSIGAGRVALNILSFSRPAYTYGIYYGVYVVDWHGPPTIRDLLTGSTIVVGWNTSFRNKTGQWTHFWSWKVIEFWILTPRECWVWRSHIRRTEHSSRNVQSGWKSHVTDLHFWYFVFSSSSCHLTTMQNMWQLKTYGFIFLICFKIGKIEKGI